jgi:hypothetical protein
VGGLDSADVDPASSAPSDALLPLNENRVEWGTLKIFTCSNYTAHPEVECVGHPPSSRLVRGGRGVHAAEIREMSGGFTNAAKEFGEINAAEKSIGNVKVKEMPDGTKVVLRGFSSDGRPTIEIQRTDGSKTEIRFNP